MSKTSDLRSKLSSLKEGDIITVMDAEGKGSTIRNIMTTLYGSGSYAVRRVTGGHTVNRLRGELVPVTAAELWARCSGKSAL